MDSQHIIQQNNILLSTTESSSYYDNLEKMSIRDLLLNINKEDQTVPTAVALVIPQIERSILLNFIVFIPNIFKQFWQFYNQV